MTMQSLFREGLKLPALLLLLLLPGAIEARNIGYDPPKCSCCSCSPTCACSTLTSDTSSSLSASEGNLLEQVPISNTQSSTGPTVNVAAVYNSYNADGSRAAVDTVMGFGWTHSYNVFLFTQFSAMFRYDGQGRVTKYALGPGGTYITANGYFETLVRISNTVFKLTRKDQTVFTFTLVPGTPFLVAGPVWQLTQIVDRNGNTTTLTYTGGNLTGITDTYGRTTSLTYTAQKKVSTVTDPAGRVTTFQYDSTGHMLTRITDPLGNSIQYSYNTLYQLTAKTDKAGRTFSYAYSNNEPVAIDDSAGSSPATLSNTGNWATSASALALNISRTYIPATTIETDGRGNTWQYQYDSNGFMLQKTAPDGSATAYTYDPATLMVASSTDADGNSTFYKYDSQGNLIQMTDALGHVTKYTYEPVFNMMTSKTDPRGRVTTYTIDPANGNRIAETDPLSQTRSWTYDSHGNVLTATDKDGHTTTYLFDSFGNRMQITDPAPLLYVTKMTYDAVGNMLTRTDANAHTTKYQYDGMNRVTVVTDPTGHTDQTIYDGQGNRIQTIDRNGHSTSYQYDLRQRLVKMTDATLIHFETYTYDGNDNRISMTDRDGHTTMYGYDVQNRRNRITDALSDVTTTTYDPFGNVMNQTDANGHTTTYTYDPLNRRSTMTDALGEETQYFYDTGTFTGPNCIQCGATPGSRWVTEQIDPDGTAGLHAGVIYFKYDALDRLVIKVQKQGCIGAGCLDTITGNDAVTTYTYDPVGNRLTATQPDGVETTYLYDADNRLLQVTILETSEPNDVTTTTYDGVSNVITVTAPNLNVTTNTYDSLNRLIQVTDSAGPVGGYTYDPVGNRLSSTDGNGNTTSYAYDALNRLMTTTDPLSKTTSNQYDPVGNLLKVMDRNSNATTYAYDAINRRISMADALLNLTQWQYDPVGNMIKLTDANGHATQFFYDAVNRPRLETYPDGLSRSYTHDDVGNLLTRTDQIGQVTTYTYSDLYFLNSRTYPSAISDSFTYDLSGRMLTAQRGAWPDSFTYDSANRVTGTTQNGQTIGYVYNIPGRTRQITYPGGRVITEHTDARTRMDHINDAAFPANIAQYTYDFANNMLSRNYRNGTTSAFAYNANNWTISIAHNNPATFAGFSYAYDNEGNKQFENKLQDPPHSECYGYDTTYRLTSYEVGTTPSCTVPVTQTSYNLDPVGNWNSKTTDSVTQTRVHNSDNELIQMNAQTLTYDANGNTQNDGTYNYCDPITYADCYDEENRPSKVTRLSDSAVAGQYQYDALNRRVQKIADASGTPVTTRYFYDNSRIIEEQNGSGVTQATYVYGNYVDEVLTMDRGGQTYYYHQNALWSVEASTDSTATPVERYSYDAYGFVTVTTGAGTPVTLNAWGTPHSAIGNPWIFTGRQLDEETGLYFYRARDYDPVKGRFLERDPHEYVDGTNLYEYVQDRPTRATDPTGLKCQGGCSGGGIVQSAWLNGPCIKDEKDLAICWAAYAQAVASANLDCSVKNPGLQCECCDDHVIGVWLTTCENSPPEDKSRPGGHHQLTCKVTIDGTCFKECRWCSIGVGGTSGAY